MSTAETLREHFEKFGVISDCAVINEPGTKKSRGFGFVEFADGIPAGLLEQEHIVGQRRCGVRAYDYQSKVDELTETVQA
jgi:RNA recognition motif-containing protein